jgi:hypothetical protein
MFIAAYWKCNRLVVFGNDWKERRLKTILTHLNSVHYKTYGFVTDAIFICSSDNSFGLSHNNAKATLTFIVFVRLSAKNSSTSA